jgi:hypothetical protein
VIFIFYFPKKKEDMIVALVKEIGIMESRAWEQIY